MQVGARIVEGAIDALVFLPDPMNPHPHEADFQALIRVALMVDIPFALSATGADHLARGMAATGRVINSAALIMTAVFLAFVVNPSPFVKMIGLGLAVAIALDATVVRMVLVPATMALLGRWNWWAPRWMKGLHARFGITE